MWLFDGAFVRGDKRRMEYYAKDAARRGWLGVAVEYRTRSIDPGRMRVEDLLDAANDAYEDGLAAVEWLQGNAARYRLDPACIVAAGVSAGAITALHLVYMPGTRGSKMSPVAGGIAVSGHSLVGAPPGRPPVIMFHGHRDDVVPFRKAEETHRKAVDVGNVNTLVAFDAGHDIAWRKAHEIRDTAAQFVASHMLGTDEPVDGGG